MVYASTNVFKKKPTIYASGVGSQYAGNTTDSVQQKQPFIQTSQNKFLGIPEKITIGSTKPTTSAYNTTSKPLSSVQTKPVSAPKVQPGSIAASGKGSQYMGNTIGTQPTTTVTKPAAPSATDAYLNKLQKIADERTQTENDRLKAKQNYIREQYKLTNDSLSASIPEYENDFNVFKANSEAGVRDIKASGETQKQNTRDYYGEAQKLDAQNRMQTRAQTGRTFANLGTTESRGEGSYQQGMENIDSEFNSVTSKRLTEQANKLSEIDATVGKAERDSIAAIQVEEGKKNSLIRQIKLAQQQNKIDEAQSLVQAYNDSQDIIDQIKENLDGLKYQSELEKEKINKETESLKTEYASLSPEFIQTGVPKTMNDFIYRSKHADMYDKITPTASSGNQGKVIGMIDKLLGADTKPITGLNRIVVPGTEAATTKASWDGLKSLLTLAERGQLKGSGAVSDFETKILEKAAAAGLDPSMSDEAFRTRLSEIRNELSSGGIASTSSGVVRVRENATGATGTIPVSEFDPSLYTRI